MSDNNVPTTESLRLAAIEALPDTPLEILGYLRHIASNKLTAVIGRCDVALIAKTEAGRKADIIAAGSAAKSLWRIIDELTKGADL